MGARFSSARTAATRDIPSSKPAPTTAGAATPPAAPASASTAPGDSGTSVTARVPSEAAPRTPGASVAGEDWEKLLNDISGAISSSPWEGSVGVRPATLRERDASWHAAQQSAATRARLPKRHLAPAGGGHREGADGGGVRGEGTAEDGLSALDEVSAALDGDVRAEAEARRGRLNQNQLLDVFYLRREDPEAWGARELCNRYGVAEEDLQNLLQYSRTVLAKDVFGLSRGVADPKRGILRFEDLR